MVAQAKREIGAMGSVSVLLGIGDNTFRAYQPGSTIVASWVEEFGGQLGPTPASVGGKADEFGILNLSPETLGAVDSDTIIVLANTGETGSAALREMETSPLWKTLPAVKANRLIRLNSQEAATQYGYLGLKSALTSLTSQWKALG